MVAVPASNLVSEPIAPAPSDLEDIASSAADKAEEELAHPHERWAAEQLALDGEDLVTRKVSHLQYLMLSEALLVGPLLAGAGADATPMAGAAAACHASHASRPRASGASHGPLQGSISPSTCEAMSSKAGFVGGSWLWWALRATCMHQHVLAGRSATLLARVNALTKQLLASIAAPSQQPATPATPTAAGLKDLTKAAAAVAAGTLATSKGPAAVPSAAMPGAALPNLRPRFPLHACLLPHLSFVPAVCEPPPALVCMPGSQLLCACQAGR